MSHTFKELKGKTAAQLKEISAGIEHEAVKGYTQLNKEHLIDAICTALDIPKHEHHEVKGINKTQIKQKIRALKQDRDSAIKEKDYSGLKKIRGEIKGLKKQLRKAMV